MQPWQKLRHDFEHLQAESCQGAKPRGGELIHVGTRRWFLKAGLAGCGLSSGILGPFDPLALSGATSPIHAASRDRKAVVLFWLSGGPSHIDMWDPKPDAPAEIRGPFESISTRIPGVRFSEHLPLQAAIADRLSVIRSVDCSASNHTPITMQAGNPLARRTDDGKDGGGYPAMGSVAAKFRGANDPELPAFVGLAPAWKADVWEAGHMGAEYAPVKGLELAGKFALPEGIRLDRLQDRESLRMKLDHFRRGLDQGDTLGRTDRSMRQAYEMVVSGKVQKAFDLSEETDETRNAYGRESVGEKGLLARRLVEAGVTFVLVSGAWGYFDNHGDTVGPWGGIEKGLKPLLPRVDRVVHALIRDLEQRGLLDTTFVMMMGEFGRTPVMSPDAGRGHWTNVMSMIAAGGGMRHGQAIGSTDARGYSIRDGIVRPQDLAATTFRHLGINLDSHWISPQGRPTPIVTEGGRPIPELI